MRSAISFAKFAAVVVLGAAAAWASNPGVVRGVVKSADGKPVAGAYVKVTNAEKGLTIMVVSRERGRYTVSNLPEGKYTAQAIGGDEQSQLAAVDVSGSKPAQADLSLTEQRAAELAPGWPGTPGTVAGGEIWTKTPLPASLPEGPGKEIAVSKCGQCHTPSWFMSFRGNREKWATLIDSMRSNIAASQGRAKDLTPEEIQTLTDYFAANLSRPPADRNSRLPRTLATGDAVKYEVVELTIPRFGSEPHEITVDVKGHGVAGERNGGRLAVFDPANLQFSEIAPPTGESPRVRLGAISKGNEDAIWTLDGGPNHRWIEYRAESGKFRTFAVPADLKGNGNGNTIRQHPNGTVWVASGGANGMVELDPETQKWSVFQSPAGIKNHRSVGPYGFSFDGAGDVWFAEYANNAVGRVDPSTGKVDDFEVPVANAIPRKVTTDKDGNIWVALHETGQLLKIDYKNPSNMKMYMPPEEHPGTYSPSADLKNGYIWVSLQSVDKIARFDPKTEKWTEFPVPTAEMDVRRIEVDQRNPNRVWWSGTISNHMGYIEVLDR